MYDLITIIAISNGIQYLYKFIRIGLFYYSSVEIANKINVSQAVKHLDNINTVYDASTFLIACNQPNNKTKNNKQKNKISSNNRKMKKLYNMVVDMVHYSYISRLERKEKRREKERNELYEERKRRDEKNDKINEIQLFEKGFYRDSVSRHYIHPDKLLTDIYNAVLKNMTDPKWTMEDKNKIKSLICSDCQNVYEFKKYDELFYFVDVVDRITKRPFYCNLLMGELVYSYKNIKSLQEKRDSLSSQEVADIESKNKCVV